MSREVDVSDPSALSDDDLRYLRDRGRLPKGAPQLREFDPAPTPIGDQPHTGDVNTIADDLSVPLGPDDYVGASLVHLRAEAERRGLDTKGNKATLVERLEAHDGDEVLA